MSNMVPGYSTADALQEILARKRLEEQDAFNNRIKEQELAQRASYQNEQADTNKMYRQAYADQRKANIDKMSREAAQDAQERAALTEFPSNPLFAKMPQNLQTAYMIAQKSGDVATMKAVVTKLATPDPTEQLVPIFSQDRDGNVYDTGQRAPKESKVVTAPAPPTPPAPSFADAGPEKNEQGIETGNRVFFDNRSGKYGVAPIRFGPKNPPAKKSSDDDLISASEANQNAKLRGKAASKPGWFGDTPAKPEFVEAYRGHTQTTIAKAKTTPRVREVAQTLIGALRGDPNAEKDSAEDIVGRQTDPTIMGLTPQERSDLIRIVGALK